MRCLEENEALLGHRRYGEALIYNVQLGPFSELGPMLVVDFKTGIWGM